MTSESRKSSPAQQVPALYAPSGARLDATDLKILRLLQTGARDSIQAIAEQIQLSHSGTLHRLGRLEESGAVLRYMAELDETIFQAWPIFWVDIALTHHRAEAREMLDRAIAYAPQVMEAIELVDEFDLLLKTALRHAAEWPALKASLDPQGAFIARARLRPAARIVKRAVPHPGLGPTDA